MSDILVEPLPEVRDEDFDLWRDELAEQIGAQGVEVAFGEELVVPLPGADPDQKNPATIVATQDKQFFSDKDPTYTQGAAAV